MQAINALRGDLGEFGQIVPQGAANAARLIAIVEDTDNNLLTDAIAKLKVLVAVQIVRPECPSIAIRSAAIPGCARSQSKAAPASAAKSLIVAVAKSPALSPTPRLS